MANSQDNSREPMLEMFLFETNEILEQLETIIIENEKNNIFGEAAINEIFRIMHTIKGSSAMMLFNNISELAHSLEDIFSFIRENNPENINMSVLCDNIFEAIDFIKKQMNLIQDDSYADESPKLLIDNNKNYLSELMGSYNTGIIITKKSTNEESQKYYISKFKDINESLIMYKAVVKFKDGCQMEHIRAFNIIHKLKDIASNIQHIPDKILEDNHSIDVIRENGIVIYFGSDQSKEVLDKFFSDTIFLEEYVLNQIEMDDEELDSLCTNATKENDFLVEQKEMQNIQTNNNVNQKQNIINVNIEKLDALMDLVGEIVITEAMVIKNPELNGLQLDNFHKAARQLRKLTDELQDIVMSIRMVSVATIFNKMKRIVRDMSRKLDKEVELVLVGEDTEVDKNIIDHLSDPLMHLVRNSIDHGIENKEKREQTGKSKVGKVKIEAKNSGGDVWIIISDDGKGLSRNEILTKAYEKGIYDGDGNELSDREVFSFILEPGFSTKEKVTEFSGRGVGMDVVKDNIDKIGGNIIIESEQGKGTSISLKIPMTLAIIDGMAIKVGKSKYTIPITTIKESMKVNIKDVIIDMNGNEMVMIRGQCYPIYRLHNMFNVVTNVTTIHEGIIVMVESDKKTACLFADELIGEQQVVVKALPKYLKKVNGLAGCTILGDGSISLILDIDDLITKV